MRQVEEFRKRQEEIRDAQRKAKRAAKKAAKAAASVDSSPDRSADKSVRSSASGGASSASNSRRSSNHAVNGSSSENSSKVNRLPPRSLSNKSLNSSPSISRLEPRKKMSIRSSKSSSRSVTDTSDNKVSRNWHNKNKNIFKFTSVDSFWNTLLLIFWVDRNQPKDISRKLRLISGHFESTLRPNALSDRVGLKRTRVEGLKSYQSI